MPLDGSGNYTRARDWTDDAGAGIDIEASLFDEHDDDVAVALNTAFYRDGQAPATGNFRMNGNRVDLDSDADSSIRSTTDDQVIIEAGGVDIIQFLATGTELLDEDAGAGGGPDLVSYRNSASAADDDVLGRFIFRGRNDAPENIDYAQIQAEIEDASDTTEDGRLSMQVQVAGTLTEALRITPLGAEAMIEPTDHLACARWHPYNGSTIPAELDVDAVVTESTFESVGPTGSGATNIWTELDDMPADAKYVRLGFRLSITSSTSGQPVVRMYLRPGDTTWAVGDGSAAGGLGFRADASGEQFDNWGETGVALDTSDRTFDITWDRSVDSGGNIEIIYKGCSA